MSPLGDGKWGSGGGRVVPQGREGGDRDCRWRFDPSLSTGNREVRTDRSCIMPAVRAFHSSCSLPFYRCRNEIASLQDDLKTEKVRGGR